MNDWVWQATPFHTLLPTTHSSFPGSISRQSGNQEGGDSEESSLNYIYYLLAGRKEEAKEVMRKTRLRERNRNSFFMPFVLPRSQNSTATISHRGILPLISRKAVHCGVVLASSPVEGSKLRTKIWFHRCAIHSKIVHLSKVFTSKADHHCVAVVYFCARGENIVQIVMIDLDHMLFLFSYF